TDARLPGERFDVYVTGPFIDGRPDDVIDIADNVVLLPVVGIEAIVEGDGHAGLDRVEGLRDARRQRDGRDDAGTKGLGGRAATRFVERILEDDDDAVGRPRVRDEPVRSHVLDRDLLQERAIDDHEIRIDEVAVELFGEGLAQLRLAEHAV